MTFFEDLFRLRKSSELKYDKWMKETYETDERNEVKHA